MNIVNLPWLPLRKKYYLVSCTCVDIYIPKTMSNSINDIIFCRALVQYMPQKSLSFSQSVWQLLVVLFHGMKAES